MEGDAAQHFQSFEPRRSINSSLRVPIKMGKHNLLNLTVEPPNVEIRKFPLCPLVLPQWLAG